MKSAAFSTQAKESAELEMDLTGIVGGHSYQVMAWSNAFVPLTDFAGGLL
jgi:hypothetical protein